MNVPEAVKRACQEPTLEEAISWICVWETERVVRQALRNCRLVDGLVVVKKNPDTSHGGGWDTCFYQLIREITWAWERRENKPDYESTDAEFQQQTANWMTKGETWTEQSKACLG